MQSLECIEQTLCQLEASDSQQTSLECPPHMQIRQQQTTNAQEQGEE